MLALALSRGDVANYVSALFIVYIILIFVYVLANMLFAFGMRPGYSRWLDVVLDFLRDVSEPYLRIFRRFLPSMGGIDLSPMLAIIVLYILRSVLSNAIAG
jgi:YggT family protein